MAQSYSKSVFKCLLDCKLLEGKHYFVLNFDSGSMFVE